MLSWHCGWEELCQAEVEAAAPAWESCVRKSSWGKAVVLMSAERTWEALVAGEGPEQLVGQLSVSTKRLGHVLGEMGTLQGKERWLSTVLQHINGYWLWTYTRPPQLEP